MLSKRSTANLPDIAYLVGFVLPLALAYIFNSHISLASAAFAIFLGIIFAAITWSTLKILLYFRTCNSPVEQSTAHIVGDRVSKTDLIAALIVLPIFAIALLGCILSALADLAILMNGKS